MAAVVTCCGSLLLVRAHWNSVFNELGGISLPHRGSLFSFFIMLTTAPSRSEVGNWPPFGRKGERDGPTPKESLTQHGIRHGEAFAED